MEGNGAENMFITEKVEKSCFYIISLEHPKWLNAFLCRVQETLLGFWHYTTHWKMPFPLLLLLSLPALKFWNHYIYTLHFLLWRFLLLYSRVRLKILVYNENLYTHICILVLDFSRVLCFTLALIIIMIKLKKKSKY